MYLRLLRSTTRAEAEGFPFQGGAVVVDYGTIAEPSLLRSELQPIWSAEQPVLDPKADNGHHRLSFTAEQRCSGAHKQCKAQATERRD